MTSLFRNRLRLAMLCAALTLAAAACRTPAQASQRDSKERIPVILDTDIGDDIDDTWALSLLLKSPEVDLKLVVGDAGKPQYRAKLLAKLLEAAGRTDVPVGVGLETGSSGEGGQAAWVRGYELSSYPGKVRPDGVRALIDTIMKSRRPITLVAIGPLPNVAAALEREPRIASRARFVGMHGSVRLGYGGSKTPAPEWNVKADPASCRRVLSAPWDVTITPLDTCGLVDLTGEQYQRVRSSTDPVARTVMENYRLWSAAGRKPDQPDPTLTRSSTLFDTVAAYLGFSEALLKMEKLPIAVTDQGFTIIQPGAKSMDVAAGWKDLNGFRELLVSRLTSPKPKR